MENTIFKREDFEELFKLIPQIKTTKKFGTLKGGEKEEDNTIIVPYYETDAGEIGQQVVAQLMQIPWGSNIIIISQCKEKNEAIFSKGRKCLRVKKRSVFRHSF